METDIKPISLVEDDHVQDSHPAVEEIELRKSVEAEKPTEIQEPRAVYGSVEVQGAFEPGEPVKVQEFVQEPSVKKEESVVTPQLTEPQTPPDVVESVEMQDIVERHVQDDEIEEVRDEPQPQDIGVYHYSC